MKISKTQFNTMQGLADFFAAGINETLLKKPRCNAVNKVKDIQAVRNIAWRLLRFGESTKVCGMISLLAKDFTGALLTATVDDLLQVRSTE